MMQKDVSLTYKQKIAFEQLQRAILRCEREGLYLWDNYGSISAVNGKMVSVVASDEDLDEPLDQDCVSEIHTDTWHGSNADDKLFVRYRTKQALGGESEG